ncbi:unnamed protein product [Hyaloperonospora brassicae]|uniref:Uncharacterized protein n=1 Tax=Hyaloperonospora brassicae TaxID=162125 RepID=A0AAV0THD9_HYABA|nr:unnamed protein product [Hyaloperonospora brassicae]
MLRFALFLAVGTLATLSVSATSSLDKKWDKQFRSKISESQPPSGTCSVCFYERTNFAGPEFCVGKRAKGCIDANPIVAPGAIKSIKFGNGCDLVVNIRVTDAPFDEHVAVFSADVADTGYNLTTSKHSVQEVYVEEAGRACFLGTPSSGDGFGVCYSEDVPVVDSRYQDSINELMLFKTDANDFDVIVYDNDNYNQREPSPVHQDVANGNSVGHERRFTGYSKIHKRGAAPRASRAMPNGIRSIKFAYLKTDSGNTSSSLTPAP